MSSKLINSDSDFFATLVSSMVILSLGYLELGGSLPGSFSLVGSCTQYCFRFGIWMCVDTNSKVLWNLMLSLPLLWFVFL
jgi:hypothetical protein